MVSLLLLSALVAPQEEFDFKRTLKANETSTYSIEMNFAGMKMVGQIVTQVKSVHPDHAIVNYKATSLDVGLPNKDPLPDLTTKVGPQNMPNAANILTGEEFLIFLAAAGITPATKAKVGGEVKVSWTNDRNDTTFEGVGKILEASKEAKTTTVQWALNMKAPKGPPSIWRLKSVYSTSNFDLLSSEGSLEGLGAEIKLKVSRKSP